MFLCSHSASQTLFLVVQGPLWLPFTERQLRKWWSEKKEATTSRQGYLLFPSEGVMAGLLKRWECRKNEARAKHEPEAFSKTMEEPRKTSVFRVARFLNRKIRRGQQSLVSFIEFEKLKASFLPHLFFLLLSHSCETVDPLSSINPTFNHRIYMKAKLKYPFETLNHSWKDL